jgi:hypothetical protein
MRKRHASRPMLESVEGRLVLSTAGILDHAHAAAALVAHHPDVTPARATHAIATHGHNADTGTTHHTTTKATHHPQKKSSGLSGLTGSFSNFFKSIGL